MRVKQQVAAYRSKSSETFEESVSKAYMLAQFERAAEIAMYYGFQPIKHPGLESMNGARKGTGSPDPKLADRLETLPEEKLPFIKLYKENSINTYPYPFMVFSRKPFCASNPTKPRERQAFNLDLIGSAKSISEALIIKTAVTILEEEGFGSIYVKVNNVGDRDTLQRFERALCAYYRKYLGGLPVACKDAARRDIFSVLRCEHDTCRTLRDFAPQAVAMLSEPHRTHFREVLEYLEEMCIPYEMDNTLMDHRDSATQTVFEIRGRAKSGGEELVLARGSRYSRLSRKAGLKKEVPALGVTLYYKKNSPSKEKMRSLGSFPRPKFCLTHLGRDAKSKALSVIEALRRAGIPMYHNLTRDKLVGQMSSAEHLAVPYVIIIGQKEALEDTVVVRDMNTFVQETIPLAELAKRLKKYK